LCELKELNVMQNYRHLSCGS